MSGINPGLLNIGDMINEAEEQNGDVVNGIAGEIEDEVSGAIGIGDVDSDLFTTIRDISGDIGIAADLAGSLPVGTHAGVTKALKKASSKYGPANALAGARRYAASLRGKKLPVAMYPYIVENISIRDLFSNAKLSPARIKTTVDLQLQRYVGRTAYQSKPGNGATPVVFTFPDPTGTEAAVSAFIEVRMTYKKLDEPKAFTFKLSLDHWNEDQQKQITWVNEIFSFLCPKQQQDTASLIYVANEEVSSEKTSILMKRSTAKPVIVTVTDVPSYVTIEVFFIGTSDAKFQQLASRLTNEQFAVKVGGNKGMRN